MKRALPTAWAWSTVGDLASDVTYGSSSQARADIEGVAVLRMGNIVDGHIQADDLKYLPSNHAEFPALFLEEGDLLFNRTNSAELVGKTAVYAGVPRPCSFASYLIRVRLKDGFEPKLLAYYINSPMGREWIASVVTQQVGQANVNGTKLKALVVPTPPVNEQKGLVGAIETQFSRIDAGVAALKRVQANLKRYRASVLKAACEGRLVPTEAELARRESRDYEPASVLLQRILRERRHNWEASELSKLKAKGKPPTDDRWKARYKAPDELNTSGLPDLPTGWCWSTVEQLCETVTDGDHQPPPQVENGIPFLVIGNIRDGAVDLQDCRFVSEEYFRALDPARSPKRGDVLYSVTGSFGIAVLVDSDLEFCVQRHIAILRPSAGMAARYLVRALSSNAAFRAASAIATGTAQKTVPLTGLRRLAVPLPPGVEQRRIAEEVDRRFTLLSALERTVSSDQGRASGLRQSLLAAAFAGKLTLPPTSPRPNPALKSAQALAPRAPPATAEFTDV